jgi:N,N'-diacetylchitobiose transport system substrate-binding protein
LKTRALAAVGITVSLSVALAACGSSSSGSTDASSAPKTGTIRLWLDGPDTPQPIVDYAVAEFAKENPGSKVVFERQQWTGIVAKLTTALSSSSSPDVVEIGNTDAQAFEAAGALKDITADKAALGGDDLVQSLVDSGTYNGKFYGAPY